MKTFRLTRADNAFQTMQELTTLCDVTLQVEDKTFQAHRLVLAARSPYFRGMFCGKFRESTINSSTPIVLQDLNKKAFRIVLDAMYSNEIELSKENVTDVLCAAHMLQVYDLTELCTSFIEQNLTVSEYQKFMHLAEKYEMPSLECRIESFILDNFTIFSNTTQFLEVSQKKLCTYLKSDLLTGSEVDHFRAALRWLHSKSNDQDNAKTQDNDNRLSEVMKCIRFTQIPMKTITDEIIEVECVRRNKELALIILDALHYHSESLSQPLYQTPMRGVSSVAFVQGGIFPDDFPRLDRSFAFSGFYAIQKASLPQGSRERMVSIASQRKYVSMSLTLCKVGNFLFLFGADSTNDRLAAERYDCVHGSWMSCSSSRLRGTVGNNASLVGDCFLLVGGMAIYNNRYAAETVTRTVSYCFTKDEWWNLQPVPSARAYASSCSHDGLLYLAGGFSQWPPKGTTSRVLYVFDIKQSLWLERSSMNEGRLGSVLTAVGDKLYAVGGFTSSLKPLPTIEAYDISQNQWSIVEKLPRDSIWKPTFPIGACAYLMGLGDSNVPPEIFESGWEDQFLARACFIKMPKLGESE